MLEGYNRAFPGCAERIVASMEQQSAHRQQLENRVVDSNCRSQRRGQTYAFILALVILLGGFFLIYLDKDAYGIASIVTAVVGVTGVFVIGKFEQSKERDRKMLM